MRDLAATLETLRSAGRNRPNIWHRADGPNGTRIWWRTDAALLGEHCTIGITSDSMIVPRALFDEVLDAIPSGMKAGRPQRVQGRNGLKAELTAPPICEECGEPIDAAALLYAGGDHRHCSVCYGRALRKADRKAMTTAGGRRRSKAP